MSKLKAVFSLEGALNAAGIDVAAAKASLVKLDEAFGGQHGDIPAGALGQWVDANFDPIKAKAFFLSLGRAWEDDLAATLPEPRKKEREMTPEEWARGKK